MTIFVKYLDRWKVFKGSKSIKYAKAFTKSLAENGISSKAYLRGYNLVWEQEAKPVYHKPTTPVAPKEEWEVKVVFRIPVKTAFSYRYTHKEILCKSTYSSKRDAMAAVERYVSLYTSNDAYYHNKMGIFTEYATEVAAYILDIEYKWHDSPLDDDIWWYSTRGDMIPLDAQNILPEFVVSKRS